MRCRVASLLNQAEDASSAAGSGGELASRDECVGHCVEEDVRGGGEIRRSVN